MHSKRCPRFCKEILGTWSSLRYMPTWGCLEFGIVGVGGIGRLVLPGTYWQFDYGTLVPFQEILGLLSWWRLLGLVHNVIVMCFTHLLTSIPSLSLYSTPCHIKKCFFTPQVLDLRVLSYMNLGYLEPKLSMPIPLSLRRSMWLVLYALEPPSGESVHLFTRLSTYVYNH